MISGTKGNIYYPNYNILINYYEDKKWLYLTNKLSCYRILYIEEGIGSVLVNKKKAAIIPLTLFYLNEKDVIEEIDITGGRIHLVCFLPSAVNNRLTIENMNVEEEPIILSDMQDKLFFEPFYDKEKARVEGTNLPLDTSRRLREILNDLHEQLFIQSEHWPCLSRSYLIELLFLMGRLSSINKENNKNLLDKKIFTIDEVINYICSNYMNKLTINDLAKQFNTNRTTLSKEFKTATGETIINYLIKVRIHIAAGMLKNTELSVTTIIERVGFKNITHFNKAFKSIMKCLPGKFRKMYFSK
jgi:AraC family L-rhamnose operon regulatory protein RhaS